MAYYVCYLEKNGTCVLTKDMVNESALPKWLLLMRLSLDLQHLLVMYQAR